MTKVGIYARISDDRALSGLGVARQEKDCRTLAKTRRWTVTEVYVDNDISAYSGKSRPAYERMLDDLKAGTIEGVIAWHPDRLHRRPVELEAFINLVEATGAVVATVQAGDLDLSSPAGRMTARIVGAVARGESEHKSARHKSKHLQLAQEGRPAGGGLRPYGFDSDQVTIRPREAEIIQEITRRLLAGQGVRGIATDLNGREVRTVTGAAWTQATIRQLVTSPRVAGLRAHRGEVISDAVWEPIVERAQWEAICRIFADPTRKTKRSARSYLLTGCLWCGRDGCGARLVSRPHEAGKRSYTCAKGPGFNGCGKLKIMAPDLERFIVRGLLHRAEIGNLDAALAAHTSTVTTTATVVDLADVERQLDELAAMYAARKIDQRRWLLAQEPLERERDRLAADLASQHRTSALSPLVGPGDPRPRWDAMTFDQQHAALITAVRVTILPATPGRNWFDPDRIVPDWLI